LKKLFVLSIVIFVALAACSQKQEAQTPAATTSGSIFETAGGNVTLDGESVTLAGMTFTPPSIWIDKGPRGMRKADYALAPVEGESDTASVTVFYFGPQGGGDVEANINRWIGQMAQEEGKAPAAVRDQLTVDGMSVQTVEVQGTYNASMGGGMMGGQTVAKPGYRLIGAVVTAPQGNVFFKLTGPDKTALAMSEGLVAMIKGVRRAQ